jgi:D-alanine-D-alanine ligase
MHICIICGGVSDESDISVASALQVSEVLRRDGHSVTNWFMDRNARWYSTDAIGAHLIGPGLSFFEFADCFAAKRPDIVFPIMHGVVGEDGRIQAMLEWFGVAYVGSGVAASAVCLNKDICKRVVQSLGIAVVPWTFLSCATIDSYSWNPDDMIRSLGSKCIVKPNDSGSSIGVSLADHGSIGQSVAVARLACHSGVLVESYLESDDVEVPIVHDGQSLYPGAPRMMIYDGDVFGYAHKYEFPLQRKAIQRDQQTNDFEEHLTQLALKIFEGLGLQSLARIDFLVTRAGVIYFNEVNTMPFLTRESCIYDGLTSRYKWTYEELIRRLVESAKPNASHWKKVFRHS